MSGGTRSLQLHRLRNQKRVLPWSGANGLGMRTVVNGEGIEYTGEYEYEWRDPDPSTSSASKADEKIDKGKGNENKLKEQNGKLSVAMYRPR